MEEVDPLILTDGEKEEVAAHPVYSLALTKQRLLGISTLTQTDEIIALKLELEQKLLYIKQYISSL